MYLTFTLTGCIEIFSIAYGSVSMIVHRYSSFLCLSPLKGGHFLPPPPSKFSMALAEKVPKNAIAALKLQIFVIFFQNCTIIRRPASALSEKLLCPPGPWGPAAVG